MAVVNSIYATGRHWPAMIDVLINEILRDQQRSFYWLAKETGVSHTTLWRLKKGKAKGITFDTLEQLCQRLGCGPGDILTLGAGKSNSRKANNRKAKKKRR